MPLTSFRLPTAAGFTLVEVLVAFIILSVGLLGILGLQNQSLKYNHLAFLDSQAQLLITDIVERVRANSEQAANYQIGFDDSPPAATTNCTTGSCGQSAMRVWDLQQWLGRVQSTDYLPSAQGAIDYNATNRQLEVSIRYSLANLEEVPAGEDPPLRTLTVTTRVF